MRISIVFILLFTIISCQESTYNRPSPSADYMILNEVEYIKEFPQTFKLGKGDSVEFDLIGIKDFKICDSLIIFATGDKDGFWNFYSAKDFQFLGKYLKQGNGPNEFIMPPFVTDATLTKENGMLYATIYNSIHRKLFKINITETLSKNRLDIDEIKLNLPEAIFNLIVLDDSSLFIRKLTSEETQQERCIWKNSEAKIPSNFESLNQSTVQKRDMDFNILSAITRYCPNNKMIVEAPIALNHLNLYSTESNWGKTICTEKNIYNISEIQEQNKWDRIYTYANASVFKEFFGVIYIGEDEKTNRTQRIKYPIIQLFNWEGKALASIELQDHATSFDIDFANGFLYTLDIRTDRLYKYDIKDVLRKLL